MTAQTLLGSRRPIVALPFSAYNVADADGTLYAENVIGTVGSNVEYPMPSSGSIVAFAVHDNAGLSTGTLTFHATVNSNSYNRQFPGTYNALHVTQQTAYDKIPAERSRFTFTAGQRVGLVWTKSGTITPTTTDLSATLYVQLDDMDT